MKERSITDEMLLSFAAYLHTEERSEETKNKYMHELREFRIWLGNQAVAKNKVLEWKESLIESGKAAVTIKGALAALHSFFAMLGWYDYRVKYPKVQRPVFHDSSRDLNRDEFYRLVATARSAGNE